MLSSLFRAHGEPSIHDRTPLLGRPVSGAFGTGRYESSESDLDDDQSSDPFQPRRPPNPLLPIFSAQHLGSYRLDCSRRQVSCCSDRIPVYHLQHSIRLLVVRRCETTLSWDQLRTPQISQFLVKPIQQEIRSAHYSRATLYALLANCLQFQKDAQLNPGSTGVSRTRALICELLAMRLMREFSTREVSSIAIAPRNADDKDG
jgi:hypothetical protein